jgi:hypothetical protein
MCHILLRVHRNGRQILLAAAEKANTSAYLAPLQAGVSGSCADAALMSMPTNYNYTSSTCQAHSAEDVACRSAATVKHTR